MAEKKYLEDCAKSGKNRGEPGNLRLENLSESPRLAFPNL